MSARHHAYHSGSGKPRAELVGEHFGMLTVRASAGPDSLGEGHRWLCDCECGGTRVVTTKKLRGGVVWHCGCKGGHGPDMTGQKFGMLVVKQLVGRRYAQHQLWLCECECGCTRLVTTGHLMRGNVWHCRNANHWQDGVMRERIRMETPAANDLFAAWNTANSSPEQDEPSE